MSNGALNGQVDYEAVLADLLAKRDQIDAAIAAINLIKGSGGGTSAASSSAAGVVAPNAFFTMGIGEAARKYLEIVKGKQTVQQITKALEQGGMPPLRPNTVYAALRRREAVNRDIIRLGDEWGLKEWFSNVSLPKSLTKTKPPKRRKTKAGGKVKSASKSEQSKAVAAPKDDTNLSMIDAVEKIMVEAGKPVHAKVLVEELKKYGKDTNVNSIRSSLPRDSKKRFVNVGENTWGLAKWSSRGEQAAKA
jgi:DNA-directed RNA polymerase delta subunit